MVEINSTDYHDFVIKNKKLIGEFDQMYQKSREVPWHQDKQVEWLDIRLTLELLKQYSPFDYICDFGAGLGYFLDILKRNVGTRKCNLIGFDISLACCKKGKKLFPDIRFVTLDLIAESNNIFQEKKRKEKIICH